MNDLGAFSSTFIISIEALAANLGQLDEFLDEFGGNFHSLLLICMCYFSTVTDTISFTYYRYEQC